MDLIPGDEASCSINFDAVCLAGVSLVGFGPAWAGVIAGAARLGIISFKPDADGLEFYERRGRNGACDVVEPGRE